MIQVVAGAMRVGYFCPFRICTAISRVKRNITRPQYLGTYESVEIKKERSVGLADREDPQGTDESLLISRKEWRPR